MYRLHPQQFPTSNPIEQSSSNMFNFKLWKHNASSKLTSSRLNHSANHQLFKTSMVYIKWILAIVLIIATLVGMLYFLTMDSSENSTEDPHLRLPMWIQSTTERSFPSTEIEESSRNEFYDVEVDRDGSISGRLAIFVQTEEPTNDVSMTDSHIDFKKQLLDDRLIFATTQPTSTVIDESFSVELVSNMDYQQTTISPKFPASLNLQPINVIDETVQSADNKQAVYPIGKSTRLFPANYPFTSGHQNSFGIPIEDDERLLRILDMIRNNSDTELTSTTAANINSATRVSPTLPNLNRSTHPNNLRPTQEGKCLGFFMLLNLSLKCLYYLS